MLRMHQYVIKIHSDDDMAIEAIYIALRVLCKGYDGVRITRDKTNIFIDGVKDKAEILEKINMLRRNFPGEGVVGDVEINE